MKLVVRVGAFGIGASGVTILAAVLNNTFPWFWLPLLMGVAVSTVVAFQPWLLSSRLGHLFCCALMFGTCLTYSMSTPPVTSFLGSIFPRVAQLIGTSVFAISVGMFAARGLTQRKTSKMTAWLFIPIAAGCILGYVSGRIGGGNYMIDFAIKFLHLTYDQASTIVHYVRKTIHFSAYGFVGYSLFRAGVYGSATKQRAAGFALLCVLCLASFDEMRQTTAPNRTGSPWDVMLDMAGATFFVGIAATLSRKKPTPKRLRA